MIPYDQAKKILKRDLSRDECCVRGSLVSGWTEDDLRFLDTFEGDVGKLMSQQKPKADVLLAGIYKECG